MSMIVQPQKNDNTTSVTTKKDILGVNLTYQDGSKITKTLNYQDKLRATAKCQNMEGEYVKFELWEDDSKGSGHNKKNTPIEKSPAIKVDSKGYARWNFVLFKTFISLAQKKEDEDKKHEYYVTAEFNGKLIDASGNVNVNNPEPRIRITPKSTPKNSGATKPKTPTQPANKPKPAPKPQPDSPKGSTHQGSKNNQPDKKGNITSVTLTDLKGKPFKKRPKFGEGIHLKIEGKNIKDKSYRLKLWEDDTTGKNDLLYDREHQFKSDKQTVYIELTGDMQETGEIGNNPKEPDTGEYWTGNYQEIFAEVIFQNIKKPSQTIDVDKNAALKKTETKKTATNIDKTEPVKIPKKGECFCTKTLDGTELKKMVIAMRKATYDEAGENFYKWNKDNLFTGGHEKFTNKSYDVFAAVLEKTFKKYEINTCIRKIHFLGQCYHETGGFMKSVEGSTKDNFWYDPFRGRGFIHLTLRGNYQKFKDDSGYDVVNNPKIVSTDIEAAAKSSGWYWKYNDMGNINPFADKDSIFDTSRLVNKPNAKSSTSINGYNQRVNAINALKTVFEYPQTCINFGKKEETKENITCSSKLNSCICNETFGVESGFINHTRVIKDHVSIIEKGNFSNPKTSIQKVILHRTAGGTTKACKDAFKAGRKNKKTGKMEYYGTHFIVGKDGIITQTANLNKITWHCAGWNSKSVGIEVVGFAIDASGKPTLGLKGQNPVAGWEDLTDVQAKSVACLVKALLNYYSLDNSKIDCHEHLAAKEKGEGQVVYNAIKDYL